MAHPWLCVGIITCECTDRSRKPSGARLRPGFSSVLKGWDLRGEIAKLGPSALPWAAAAALSPLHCPGKTVLRRTR